MKKVLKKILIIIGIILAVVVVLVSGVLLWGHIYHSKYEYNVPSKIERTDGGETIIAKGRALYDEKGDVFEIRGVNFGNLFIAEGWMTVNSLGALYNKKGEFKKVNEEGIVEEYEELYQEEMDKVLADRFTDEEIENLNDAYFYSYCSEQDFINIKEIGFNTIRLPVYYRNFLSTHDRYRLTDEELCESIDFSTYALDFEKLDYFLALAKKHDLKVIIDMHGVMGGQSGFEHCGTRDIDFWDNESYIQFTCDLWQRIAMHYNGSEYSSTILAYDLINEPTSRKEIGTGPKQWKVMDKIYRAIREVDNEHVISIEGVWLFCSLPNPKKYDWQNVLYQYHFYNWTENITPNWMFYDFMYALLSFSDFEVPKFVGEFNFFDNEEAWMDYLNLYDKTGLGWTVWSYKIVSVGWWDNSWGMSVYKMNIKNDPSTPIEEYKLKLDLRTASYEEILQVWGDQFTDDGTNGGRYRFEGQTVNIIRKYFAQDKFNK